MDDDRRTAHFCPLCGKKFWSQEAVKRHLSQPKSYCRLNHEDPFHFQQPPLAPLSGTMDAEVENSEHAESELNNIDSALEDMEMDLDLGGDHDLHESIFSKPQADVENFFSELYPRAAKDYGVGDMMMDIFNSDTHAEKRKYNLYYPFASKDEWQLASSLLWSTLSMAEIDSFLKLELDQLPPGATLLGTILSSDKTNISVMTGGRVAHPLLISLANISMNFWNKPSNNAFLLLALVPIPKFLHPTQKIRGILEGRLFHECLDSVIEPLKKAAQIGVLMADPIGINRWCFTPCAAYIVDTPESALIAGVAGMTSLVTLASFPQFGDPFRHPSRTASITLDTIEQLETFVDPWDLSAYERESLKVRLNGIHRPFWRDWPLSEPSTFLTIINNDTCDRIQEALQIFHSHKQAILDAEARQGKNGPIENWHIPKLEFLQSVVPNIQANGAAIQWSADMTEHAHIGVIKEPARSGNNQAYEPQICRFLDRLNKLDIFDLATAILEAGINFGKGSRDRLLDEMDDESEQSDDDEGCGNPSLNVTSTAQLVSLIDPVGGSLKKGQSETNYFYRATLLQKGAINSLLPHRTIRSAENVVFHLCRNPTFKQLAVDDVSTQFELPDLRPALADYLNRLETSDMDKSPHIQLVGGRRFSPEGCPLPFTKIEVWQKVRLQTTTYHYPHDILPPVTINARPPSKEWPHGQFDQAIFNLDAAQKWPKSGLKGHIIVDLWLIFHIVPSFQTAHLDKNIQENISGHFLAYVQRYDIIQQLKDPRDPSLRGPHPEPAVGLHLLQRAKRVSGEPIGDVVPLSQLRCLADVTPRMAEKAEQRWTKENSLHYATEFWLNKSMGFIYRWFQYRRSSRFYASERFKKTGRIYEPTGPIPTSDKISKSKATHRGCGRIGVNLQERRPEQSTGPSNLTLEFNQDKLAGSTMTPVTDSLSSEGSARVKNTALMTAKKELEHTQGELLPRFSSLSIRFPPPLSSAILVVPCSGDFSTSNDPLTSIYPNPRKAPASIQHTQHRPTISVRSLLNDPDPNEKHNQQARDYKNHKQEARDDKGNAKEDVDDRKHDQEAGDDKKREQEVGDDDKLGQDTVNDKEAKMMRNANRRLETMMN
ncbi:hypothetical protein NLJ89_g1535 [Agrocybe chaxingu]|uniref:DUF6830 domain-containing protein n=1 Tax=Agrocybe chaxingu TaxID=84603 RepID=A0A9W8TF17_9AGAR|nr:hypothetical protein NLJ89_g1535 [Agrocybe chaxingu]